MIELSDGEVKTVDIKLEHAEGELTNVVVTGTMRPVMRSQSPITVDVYTPQFFKRNPSPSLFESMQMVNGVRPQINCNVCNTGDIHINGLEGPYTMVTIDGMPIVSSLASVYGLFGIPSQLIERVEVIKGPASGLYGSEAIGGLINIITKSTEKAPVFTANLMSTSWNEHLLDVGYKYSNPVLSSLVGINYYNYLDPRDNNEDGFTDVTLQHRVSVFNKWNFKRKTKREASVAGRYFYEDRWGGEINWKPEFRGGDSVYGESIYTKRWELIGRYQLPVNEPLHLSFSGTVHDQNSWYGNVPYIAKQKIGFAQLIWDKTLSERNQLLTGIAGRYNYYDDNSTATKDTLTGKNKPDNYIIPGIFLQHEWKAGPKHALLSGLRFDFHPVHKTIITPRVAWKWNTTDKQVIRVNAGTGFRVVNLFTEEHAALTGARAVVITEELHPEKSYNVNVNFSQQLGTRSAQFHIDASAWYTYFHNQIIADYETDPNKILYHNLQGYSVSSGFSFNTDFNISQRFKGSAGLTLQDVNKVDRINGKKIRERPMLTEKWSSTWNLTYTLPIPGLTFDYTGNVYGPMRLPLASDLDPRPAYSPVWSIQNLQVTKWFSSKLEAYGGVKNLFNWTPGGNTPFLISRANDPFDKKLDYDGDGKTDLDGNGKVLVTPENPYGLTFDPGYVYAPNQGRRVFLGLRYKIQ
jgi:outer membrane receptor for ferrienterochelin and colicins